MLRPLIVFAAGFILAAILFSVHPLTAQDAYPVMPAPNLAYVKEAKNHLLTLDAFFDTMKGFYSSESTSDEIIKAHRAHTALTKKIDLQQPPIELLAIHTQLQFAAYRCENLAFMVEGLQDVSKATGFDYGIYATIRESCASYIHNARLRLIDYAAPYGVNPFD